MSTISRSSQFQSEGQLEEILDLEIIEDFVIV